VRILEKSLTVFRLFEKVRYSNEKSTKFESQNGGISRRRTMSKRSLFIYHLN